MVKIIVIAFFVLSVCCESNKKSRYRVSEDSVTSYLVSVENLRKTVDPNEKDTVKLLEDIKLNLSSLLVKENSTSKEYNNVYQAHEQLISYDSEYTILNENDRFRFCRASLVFKQCPEISKKPSRKQDIDAIIGHKFQGYKSAITQIYAAFQEKNKKYFQHLLGCNTQLITRYPSDCSSYVSASELIDIAMKSFQDTLSLKEVYEKSLSYMDLEMSPFYHSFRIGLADAKYVEFYLEPLNKVNKRKQINNVEWKLLGVYTNISIVLNQVCSTCN